VRYRFLAEVAERLGTPYIATGHHRSDQAETILLHIIRAPASRPYRP
jgi:tRNA(Ile)-lysidine synthase